MNNIIQFPSKKLETENIIEKAIDLAISNIKPEYKNRIKQEALNTFKKHEHKFIDLVCELPESITQIQISKLKELFEEQHKQKIEMLLEILQLNISGLIDKIELETYNK